MCDTINNKNNTLMALHCAEKESLTRVSEDKALALALLLGGFKLSSQKAHLAKMRVLAKAAG